MTHAHESGDPMRLRFEFVDMLFALAVGEVATHASLLVKSEIGVMAARSAWSNLALAFCVVATSWVGWSNSKAEGHKKPATRVFSAPFVLLALDVLLVVLYYIIAQGVEMPEANGAVVTLLASADGESKWLAFVFLLYLLWDFLSKAVMAEDGIGRAGLKTFAQRGWISFLCLVLAAYVWWFLSADAEGSANRAVCIDFGLISIVFLFRSLKEFNRSSKFDWAWLVVCGAGLVLTRVAWHFL